MKTIEEKAKAYDEIIERAKTMLAAGEVMYGKENNASQLITDIIPELKESEDERINKAIFKALSKKEARDVLLAEGVQVSEALAYLEKQKEQKPAEWNEEDIEAFVKSYSDSLPMCGEFQSYHDALVHAYRQGVVNTLKSLRLQLEQNLSDEDEKILHAIEFHIGQLDSGETINGFSSSDMLRVLKSLRSQPKQDLQIKEGDKVSIHCRKDRKEDIIAIYDGKVGEVIHVWDAKRNPWGHIVVRLDDGFNNGFYEDELEVLNEPKWKLSEEQIYTLERICSNLHLRASDDAPKLDEIIEQLKQK